MILSESLIQEYDENGVVCLRGVIDQDFIDRANGDIDEILLNPEERTSDNSIPSDTGRFFNGFFQWLTSPNLKKLIMQSALPKLAGDFLRCQQWQFFYDQLMVKEAGTSQRTPWHLDSDYFPIKGNITSIWVPFLPVDASNGTMRFIKGSHKQKIEDLIAKVPNKKSRDEGRGMYILPDFDLYPEHFEFLEWDLEPGDVLAFHNEILHFAYANNSDRIRRAMSTRWFDSRCTVDESQLHILNKEDVLQFLQKQGYEWDGSLQNPLFPCFEK